MAFLTDQDWVDYINAVNEFNEDAGQQPITWLRSKGGLDRFGEDNLSERFDTIELKGLILYNVFRTWPIDRNTESGALDNQNCMLFLNSKYLDSLGFLNSDGYIKLGRATDYFILSGIKYKPAGDTQAAQAKPVIQQKFPLMTCIILTRIGVER